MVHSSNHFYGHSAILNAYVTGRWKRRAILGMLQHGWQTGAGFGPDAWVVPWLPKFVWNEENRTAAHRDGHRLVRAIGAPFTYLTAMRGVPSVPESGYTLMYPFHGTQKLRVDSDHVALAQALRRRERGDVIVCLYWIDYEKKAIRHAYEEQGLEVISHGHMSDTRFLIRQYEALSGARRVVANRVATALWYGAYLSREVGLVAPSPSVEGNQRREWGAWPRGHESIPGPDARQLAELELGGTCRRPSSELASLFSWKGIRRVLVPPAAGVASLRRMLRR